MRLTLRTLLAWLDDTLPPAQVRDIGGQVAESPLAQELVEKIQRVTRRRRLTVPSKTGPEATDPNIVASYVDNDLEPDLVAEYEKKCLSSDVNLAEVASVHQILSLLGQKVQVPAEAKSRMYSLVKGREAMPKPRPNGHGDVEVQPFSEAIQPWIGPVSHRRHWPDRLGPVAACLGLLAVLISSAYLSLRPEAGPSTLTHEVVIPGPSQKSGETSEAGTGTLVPYGAEGDDEHSIADNPVENKPSEASGSIDSSSANQPVTPEVVGLEGGSLVPSPNPEIPDTSDPKPSTESKNHVASSPIRALPAGAIAVIDRIDGILLRFDPDGREWTKIEVGRGLQENDRILVLAPFRARVVIGRLPVTLLGESQLIVKSHGPAGDPAFELVLGRASIDQSAAAGKFKALFAGRTLEVDRKSPGNLGLERTPSWHYGEKPGPEPAMAVMAADGEIVLQIDKIKETFRGPRMVLLDPSGHPVERQPTEIATWVIRADSGVDHDPWFEPFLKVLQADRPMLASLVGALDDERAEIKRLAIGALKALDDLSWLSPILKRENDHVARRATIGAMREVLGRGEPSARRLRQQLEEDYGVETAQRIEKLLRGYSQDERAKDETSRRLIDMMAARHEPVEIRELALDNLMQISGKDEQGYDADHPEGIGTTHWRELQQKGKLKGPAVKK